MFLVKKSIFWSIVILNLAILIAFQNCSPQTFTKGANEVRENSEPTDCSSVTFSISSNPTEGIAGVTPFQFSANSNQEIDNIVWSFCEGGATTYENILPPPMQFPNPDSSCTIAALATIGDCVKSDTENINIQIDNPNLCPGIANLNLNGPISGLVGETLNYELLFRGCNIDSAVWNFGDGSAEQSQNAVAGSDRFENSHAYTQAGEYLIQVRVTDAGGAAATITLPVVIQVICPSPSELFISGVGFGIIGEPYDYFIFRPNLSCPNYTFQNNSWNLKDQDSANVGIDNPVSAPSYFITQQTFEDRVAANPEYFDWSAQANFTQYSANLSKRVYMTSSTGNCDATQSMISGPSVVDLDTTGGSAPYKYQVYVPACLQPGTISTTTSNSSTNPIGRMGSSFDFRFIKSGNTRLDSTIETATNGTLSLSKNIFVRGCKVNEANGSVSYLRHLGTRNFYSINQGSCVNTCSENLIVGTCQVNRVEDVGGNVLIDEDGVIQAGTNLSCTQETNCTGPQCGTINASHTFPAAGSCAPGTPSFPLTIDPTNNNRYTWNCTHNGQTIPCFSNKCNFDQSVSGETCQGCPTGQVANPSNYNICFDPCGSSAGTIPVLTEPTGSFCNNPAVATGTPIVTTVGSNYQWTCSYNYSPGDTSNRFKTCTVPRACANGGVGYPSCNCAPPQVLISGQCGVCPANSTYVANPPAGQPNCQCTAAPGTYVGIGGSCPAPIADFVELLRATCTGTSNINSAATMPYSPDTLFSHPFNLALTGSGFNAGTWCTYLRVPANYDASQLTHCLRESTTEAGVSSTGACTYAQVPDPIATLNYSSGTKKVLMFTGNFGLNTVYKSDTYYRTQVKYKAASSYGKFKFTCPAGQVPVNNGTACGPAPFIDVNFSTSSNSFDTTTGAATSTTTSLLSNQAAYAYIRVLDGVTTFNVQYPVMDNLEVSRAVTMVPTATADIFYMQYNGQTITMPSTIAPNCGADQLVLWRRVVIGGGYTLYRATLPAGCSGTAGTYTLSASYNGTSDAVTYTVNPEPVSACTFNGISIPLGQERIFSRLQAASCGGSSCNTIRVSCSTSGVRSITSVVGIYTGIESNYPVQGACTEAVNCPGQCIPSTNSCSGDTHTQNYSCSNGNCPGGCPSQVTQNSEICICRDRPDGHLLCWTSQEWNRYGRCINDPLAFVTGETFHTCMLVDASRRDYCAEGDSNCCQNSGTLTPGYYPGMPENQIKVCCGPGYYQWYRANNSCP